MKEFVDVDLLLTFIECRPALWCKTHENYKDRCITRDLWNEICLGLNSAFESYDAQEKKTYVKKVIRRWINIRDAYTKYIKKTKHEKPGTTAKYLYADQLKFLNKTFTPESNDDTLPASPENVCFHFESCQSSASSDEDDKSKIIQIKTPVPQVNLITRKRKSDQSEPRKGRQQENRHMSFFKSLIPTLETFTDDQTIKFQMGVLQVITDIRQGQVQSQQQLPESSTEIANDDKNSIKQLNPRRTNM